MALDVYLFMLTEVLTLQPGKRLFVKQASVAGHAPIGPEGISQAEAHGQQLAICPMLMSASPDPHNSLHRWVMVGQFPLKQ